jgi:hypothetical protein
MRVEHHDVATPKCLAPDCAIEIIQALHQQRINALNVAPSWGIGKGRCDHGGRPEKRGSFAPDEAACADDVMHLYTSLN